MTIRSLLLLAVALALCSCPRTPPPDDDDGANDDDVASDDDDSADDDDSGDDDPCDPDPCTDPDRPYCVDGECLECTTSDDPVPEGLCQGVCTLQAPLCVGGSWQCSGPGYEEDEVSCDGFDNDCDGEVDEGDICPDCDFDPARIEASLYAIWDLDFDFECATYLTSLISGPDFTTVLPADVAEPNATYYGNANQDMGYALVDPDPENRRVVVNYSCCPSCGCSAANGLTLLYTCDPGEPGCGCASESNCPGFLDEPFLRTASADTHLTFQGFPVTSPNGLAVGPRNSYYVGNFMPETCSDEAGCVACDPDHPGVLCSTDQPNCCDTTPLGRLARFTLPTPATPPTWRVEQILEGEEILGLASGRDTSVWIGTWAGDEAGNLYRFEPSTGALSLIASYDGAVFSITQDRLDGDWYVEVRADPKIVHLAEDGSPLPLPASVEANPPDEGILQWGPDDQLYRLIGRVDATSSLEVYPLP